MKKLLLFICLLGASIAVKAQESHLKPSDTLAFLKYLHMEMPLHTDVLLMHKLANTLERIGNGMPIWLHKVVPH